MSATDTMLERAAATAGTLLAGVSFALIALVLQLHRGDVRWPDLAILFLVGAGVLLVGSVQAALWAAGDAGGWASFARFLYNVGVLALLAAVTVLLVPAGSVPILRWLAVGTALAGFLGEAAWQLYGLNKGHAAKAQRTEILGWMELMEPGLSSEQATIVLQQLAARGIATLPAAKEEHQRIGTGFNTENSKASEPVPTPGVTGDGSTR